MPHEVGLRISHVQLPQVDSQHIIQKETTDAATNALGIQRDSSSPFTNQCELRSPGPADLPLVLAGAMLSDKSVALVWVRQPQPAASSIDKVNIEKSQQFVKGETSVHPKRSP